MAETTYLEAIRQALFEEMDRDPAVVLIGEDVGVYGGALRFRRDCWSGSAGSA